MSELKKDYSLISSHTPNSRSIERRSAYEATSDKRFAFTKSTFRNESDESIMSKISKMETYYKSKLNILNERINDLHNENKVLYEENQRIQNEMTSTKLPSKGTRHSNDLESLFDDSNSFERRENGKIKRDAKYQKLEMELMQSREREKDLQSQLNDFKLKFKSALNLQSLILTLDLEKNQKLCKISTSNYKQIRHSSVTKPRREIKETESAKEITKVRSELKEMKKENFQIKEFLERMSNMNSKRKEDSFKEIHPKPSRFMNKSTEKSNSDEQFTQLQRQETFAPDSGKRELEHFQKNMSNFRNILQIEENSNLLNEQELEGLQKQLGFN